MLKNQKYVPLSLQLAGEKRCEISRRKGEGGGGAKMGWICCFLSQTLATCSRDSAWIRAQIPLQP